jgi:NAD(P)-dependent dehydrogenase (short-subunit alcohol dehydrogenase family)
VHHTRSRAQRRQQPNKRAAGQVIHDEQRGQACHTNPTNGCPAQGVKVVDHFGHLDILVNNADVFVRRTAI